MKGIIFNLLEEFISKEFGDVVLEEIYVESKLQDDVPPFLAPVSYSDDQILSMVVTLSEKTGESIPDLLHAIGKFSIPILAEKYSVFFENCKDFRKFMQTVNEIHFIEIKKLYDDARPPEIIFQDIDKDTFKIHYRSQRKLCDLAKGLIEGTAEIYETDIQYKKESCMNDGKDECIFEVIVK